ncbi:unnamed protein product [Brugia pahangi]|uniref:Uncharacterized protein n=1 Tax=Brugia pahangi TaxID=6280 RepID=A0A0N4TLR2_BRUPA|nr:unnamed protein product [Brugia pahangi]
MDDGGNDEGSVHDGDGDDTGAMVHPSHRPTSQMLSPILSTELAIILWQILVIPFPPERILKLLFGSFNEHNLNRRPLLTSTQ